MKNVNATLETYSEITEVDGSYAIVVSTLLPILVLLQRIFVETPFSINKKKLMESVIESLKGVTESFLLV